MPPDIIFCHHRNCWHTRNSGSPLFSMKIYSSSHFILNTLFASKNFLSFLVFILRGSVRAECWPSLTSPDWVGCSQICQLKFINVATFRPKLYNFMYIRVSSGSIVSDYGLDDRAIGVRSPAGAKDFSSILCVQTGFGAHPASYPMGTGILSSGVKRGRGVILTTHPHLVPRSRMSRSYTSSPPKRLNGV
jgi:hypothetical protein